jgi:hypothetical protein
MQPVSAEILKFYLDAGWPQEMIYHLFIERFELSPSKFNEIKSAAEVECSSNQSSPVLCADAEALALARTINGRIVIDNDPRNHNNFRLFQAFLRRLEALGLNVSTEQTERSVTYPKPVMASLEQLMKLNNARVEQLGDGVKVTLTERKSGFSFRNPTISAEVSGTSTDGVTVITRSADAALYYLGEIIEAQLEANGDPGLMPTILTAFPDPKPAALFAITRNETLSGAPLSIDYAGDTFAIPPANWVPGGNLRGHRSMQVIALMNQVFALHKKGSTAPSVVPVTVLN